MIEIEGKIRKDIDEILQFYEPKIKKVTDKFLVNNPEKDDCRQLLRLKIVKLFNNTERVFNEAFVSKRLKWDTINFINRDFGYKWHKTHYSLDRLGGVAFLETLEASISKLDLEKDILLEDLVIKAKPVFKKKEYEAIILFLSGANRSIISRFIGVRRNNLTRYYLSLSDAIEKIRQIAEEESDAR